jgi:hypothetical protein
MYIKFYFDLKILVGEFFLQLQPVPFRGAFILRVNPSALFIFILDKTDTYPLEMACHLVFNVTVD